MVELFVRIAIALGALGAGALGLVPFDLAWKVSAAIAALSLFGWRLQAKALFNSGIAGFFAVADAFALALLLAGGGELQRLGFLILVPCIYAGARFGSPMISMAPLAASALVAADSFFSKTGIPSTQVLVHAAGVLSVSLLLGQRRPQPRQIEVPILVPEPAPQIVEDGLLQLRENYRKLRDAYSDLERRSRRDKIAARISKCQEAQGDRFYTEICAALKELAKAEELAVYTLAQYADAMIVRGVSQDFPGDIRDRAIEVDISKAPAMVREQAEKAVSALAIGASVVNVLLTHKGKMVGMVCAIDANAARLDQIRKNLIEAAPDAAMAIDAELERHAQQVRITELEMLYEIGAVVRGASTPPALAARVTRELHDALRLDNISVTFVEGGEEMVLSREGTGGRLIDCMSFAKGPGVPGWLATGAPELVLFDARQDSRCDPEETLKRRIGSFVLIPLWAGTEVLGYLSASTQVAGGIDVDQIRTLRVVAAELCRALERLVGAQYGGLMTPQEFAAATESKNGVLVYFEPLRREQMVATYGFAAFEEAVRKLAYQIRGRLPAGACMCRREQNDFLVFLDTDEEFARNWANEVAASASFIAIPASDPSQRVPLALRAKVAKLSTHSDQISPEFAA